FYNLVAVEMQAAGPDMWKNYSQVVVEITGADDASGANAQSFNLTSAAPKASWVYRPAAGAKSGYRYRKTYIAIGGPPTVVDWTDATGPEILVADLHTDVLSVMVATDLD